MARLNALYTASAVQINGTFIEALVPGFHTLGADGREMLEKQLELIDKYSDGSLIKTRRYPERVITVSYMVEGTAEQIRERLTILAGILNTDNAEIIFNDEGDKFLTGTLSGTVDIEKAQGVYSGEYTITCVDPFKYSVEEFIAVTDSDGVIECEPYNGTYKTFPTMNAFFHSDCGYVGFVTEDGAIIQVGSTNETDYNTSEASEKLINDSAASIAGWTLNGATLASSATQTGTVNTGTIGGATAVKANSYGSGSGWHGPTLTQTIPADSQSVTGAENFTWSWRQRFAQGKSGNKELVNQYGAFQAVAVASVNGTKKVIAGVTIVKSASGKKATITCYVNGKSQKTVNKAVVYSSKMFGFASDAVLNSKIIKSGAQLSFNVGGWTWSTTNSDIENIAVTEISFAFLAKGTAAKVAYNGIYKTAFTKNNVAVYEDVPNKFELGDVLLIDCETANITLNALDFNSEGALGNDWEQFVIEPNSNNIIQFVWSDWVQEAPSAAITYRERYI